MAPAAAAAAADVEVFRVFVETILRRQSGWLDQDLGWPITSKFSVD